jgi:hypothetical protein
MNDVVALLGEPAHELRRLLAVHELERPRRYELHVGAVMFQGIEMAFRANLGMVERDLDLVVRNFNAAAPMRAARRQQHRLVGP